MPLCLMLILREPARSGEVHGGGGNVVFLLRKSFAFFVFSGGSNELSVGVDFFNR